VLGAFRTNAMPNLPTGILLGDTTNVATAITDGSSGQILSTDGNGTYSFINDNAITSAESPLNLSANQISLGTVPVTKGGTGATTLTGILLGNATSAISGIISAVDGNVLTADGSGGYAFEGLPVKKTGTITVDELAVFDNADGTLRSDSTISIDSSGNITFDQGTNNYLIGGGNIAGNVGSGNVGLGHNVLTSQTSGNNNIAIGFGVLDAFVTGASNIALGDNSMGASTGGTRNIAIGKNALQNGAGSYNLAIGDSSMSSGNLSGLQNTCVGYTSGNSLTSGGNNLFIGNGAGSSVTTVSNNVILGSNNGSTITDNNNIIISDGGGNNRLQFSNTGAATFKATTPSPVVSTPIVSIADSVNGVLGGIGALASGGYPLQIWGGTLEFKTGSSSNIATATTKLTISTGGDATFSGDVIINTENSGIIVDLASRHGLMKYANYGAGLVGKDTGTDSNISTWLGRFSGTITSPTAVYQDLIISNSGNVGIGTTPTSKLTLLGTSTAASNTPSDAIVDIRGTSTAHLLMGVANVSPYGAWINTDSTAQPLVLMGTGGKVGIGTGSTAPQNNLTIQTATDVRVGIYGGVGYSGIQSISDNNNVWKQLRLDGSDIQFRIQDVPKLTISSGGTVKADAFAPLNSSTSILDFSTLNVIKFYTNSTPRLTISSGGVTSLFANIGSAVDNAQLQIKSDGSAVATGLMFINSANTSSFNDLAGIASYIESGDAKGNLQFWTRNSDGNNNDRTTRLTISSGGDVLIGTTSSRPDSNADEGIAINPTGKIFVYSTSDYGVWNNSTTGKKFYFRLNNAEIGSIQYNTSSVAYNTSSDYRLKENVTPITDALSRVNQLKPSRFNFIIDADKIVDGFLAHEVQDIVPEAISGEKDAMRDEEYEVTPRVEEVLDEEGNVIAEAVEAVMETRSVPDYQGIDQSKIVPLLTAAIQEQQTIIEDLKARIEKLEL